MLATQEPATASTPAHGTESLSDLYSEIRAVNAKLARSDGRQQRLPQNLHAFLLELLAELKAGKPVTILESSASTTMTTAAAARTLSVSRQFFVRLLEQGQIPFHKVGTHRRVYTRDLLAYKAKRDAERREAWSDLVRAEIEDGTYFAVPMNALVKQ